MRASLVIRVVFIVFIAAMSSLLIAGTRHYVSGNAMLTKLSGVTGLVVENIEIHGTKNVTNALDIIECQVGAPILGVDIWRIKNSLESRLAWVKNAVVARRFPNTIEIYIEERVPVAIWRDDRGNSVVIDEEGNAIIPYIAGDKLGKLMVLSGTNANKCVNDVREIMSVDRAMIENVALVTRVGDRRWTVSMKNGVDVLLPEENYLDAWIRAVDILRGNDTTPVKAIDMRVSDKIYFIKK